MECMPKISGRKWQYFTLILTWNDGNYSIKETKAPAPLLFSKGEFRDSDLPNRPVTGT
jgi:hypothetical protein